MFDRILFPTDGSDGAMVLLDHVLDIAAAHGASLHLLYVADTSRMSNTEVWGEIVDTLEIEGERVVQEAADRATSRNISTVTDVVQGEPYDSIIAYADTNGIDIIVMPTRGRRGLERFLLGSTTERVVRRANVPVLTVRPDDDRPIEYPYENVLVPTDGSECANLALSVGIDIARTDGAALHLLTVISVASLGMDVESRIQTSALEEGAKNLLVDAEKTAEEAGIDAISRSVRYGQSIHRVILSYVDDHDIDIVVVGTRGRTGFDRYVLGSVTEYLVRTAPVPVLTVRGPEK